MRTIKPRAEGNDLPRSIDRDDRDVISDPRATIPVPYAAFFSPSLSRSTFLSFRRATALALIFSGNNEEPGYPAG